MKSIVPWSWGDQHLKSLLEDDFLPQFSITSVSFPKLDIEDKEKELIVTADVPGYKQSDIKIEAEADRLIIQGKTSQQAEEKKKNYYRQERRSGNFYREIFLPCEVDNKKVSAKFNNGTLQISLPKTNDNKSKRINVEIK